MIWDWLSEGLDGPVAVEARRLLGERRLPSKNSLEMDRQRSIQMEMMQPEVGAECMDISICAVEALEASSKPLVVLLRCERPLHSLRYVAVVVCSARGGKESMEQARQVSRALASGFVDERFVREVRDVPIHEPLGVLEAFDRFLSTLTIVPTVHLGEDTQKRPRPAEPVDVPARSISGTTSDLLLSHSLQKQMEGMLCKSLGIPQLPKDEPPVLPAPGSVQWKRCFVQVDCLDLSKGGWKMTHQLRQGMEIDAGTGKKPHLPHVNVRGLAKVRELMGAKNVALDVRVGSGQAAVDVIIRQLGLGGLPTSAMETVASALRDRALQGVSDEAELIEPDSPFVGRQNAFIIGQDKELVAPCEDDDAFLILLVPSQEVPSSNGITSACLRFTCPVQFAQSETPVRFLVVLVGPQGAEQEMSQCGDSFAALAADEDLVGSLDAVSDEASFADAMFKRMDDLPMLPRSHLEAQNLHKDGAKGERPLEKDSASDPSPREIKSEAVPESAAIPHKKKNKKPEQIKVEGGHDGHHDLHHGDLGASSTSNTRLRRKCKWIVSRIQKYSLPLVFGVLGALAWKNVDDHSYHLVIHEPFHEQFQVFGHQISLHFLVNDIFMCFFFGLAIKEVTEALLPGGSLSPLQRAANPLMATCGGILGPIAMYFVMVFFLDAFDMFDGNQCLQLDARRLAGGGGSKEVSGTYVDCTLEMVLKGWGVPTATDISLAWMFALLIFGAGHPAINFLLLLAIVDDAIGMIIIAVAYPNPEKPVEPIWLLLVVAASVLALILRLLKVRWWPVYIFLCGPVSWTGLLKAHVHPALALVFVVPFMPASHAVVRVQDGRHLGAGVNWRPHGSSSNAAVLKRMLTGAGGLRGRATGSAMVTSMFAFLMNQENAPLHLFEHHLKFPVDLGMFYFGLANAGVELGTVGGVTIAVLVALIVGKTLGVAGFGLLAHCMGFPLPAGITFGDLLSLGALAGIGLTVALFVSNEAFTDPGLQGQAKMGALLSVLSCVVAYAIKWTSKLFERHRDDLDDELDEADDIVRAVEEGKESDDALEEDDYDDIVTDELMQMMWTQRKYKARGEVLRVEEMVRKVSKNVRSEVRKASKFSVNGGVRDLGLLAEGDENRVFTLAGPTTPEARLPGSGQPTPTGTPRAGRTTSNSRLSTPTGTRDTKRGPLA